MKKFDWSEERLRETVKRANCWFNWLEILGINKHGNNYKTLKSKAELYRIDTSHFSSDLGRSRNNNRNLYNLDNDTLFTKCKRKPDIIKREYIHRVLNDIPRCEECGIKDWNGKELIFQIHHKDGDHDNNMLENLILLCPNCHSQTDNFSNKKRNNIENHKSLERDSLIINKICL